MEELLGGSDRLYKFVEQVMGLLSQTPLHTYAAAVVVVLVTWMLRRVWKPLDITKTAAELRGKGDEGIKERRRKNKGQMPPPYPIGWFHVCNSVSLKKGDVKSLKAFGQELVLFRGENGLAALLDAYCPHLGADLGVGGKVVGNNIECPFHGWRFCSDSGKCTHIPNVDRIPEIAKLAKHYTREVNGAIYVWFDVEKREPLWEICELPSLNRTTCVLHGQSEHEVEAHCQEIPEGNADATHLTIVPSFLQSLVSATSGSKKWVVGQNPSDQHIAYSTITQSFNMSGAKISEAQIRSQQQGPGICYIEVNTAFGNFVIAETVTPVKPMVLKVSHAIYGTFFNRVLAKAIFSAIIKQFETEITIWNNKVYQSAPVLSQDDQNISEFRRWYQQFYSKNVKTLDW